LPAQTKSKSLWILIPIIGSILFVILYIVAAVLYPGGSGDDKTAIGYSLTNNYWCNLLNEKAINEQHNTARPIAIIAMFILCLTLSIFWFTFPLSTVANKCLKLAIQFPGIAAMLVSLFLLSGIDHDLVVNIASSLGVIATLGVMICLYQINWYGLFAFGLVNIFLVGLNNYLYHTEGMLIFLPVVQKISFLSFLVWICLMDLKLYHKN
jgi:hypothetical protein